MEAVYDGVRARFETEPLVLSKGPANISANLSLNKQSMNSVTNAMYIQRYTNFRTSVNIETHKCPKARLYAEQVIEILRTNHPLSVARTLVVDVV